MSATKERPMLTRDAAAVLPVLIAVSGAHLINDLLQALLPALYPLLKARYALNFAEIGVLTLVFQSTAALLQPVVGQVTDARPMPYSLPVGMAFSLGGILALAAAGSYGALLAGAACLGLGSAIFHPESSRVARLASGGRFGFAQSLFQVGGNAGQSLGPLLAAFVIVPRGQQGLAWFALVAMGGIVLLARVGRWYGAHGAARGHRAVAGTGLPRGLVARSLAVLIVLMISKFLYLASLNTYLTFYLMQRYGIGLRDAQLHLFLFAAAVAAGTFIGGPIGDRIGRKRVIWVSILGTLPFSLALPHVGLAGADLLLVAIGLILSSAFSAILVHAQDLLPGRVGLISGLFFGLAFGLGGIGAAGLGVLIDQIGLERVYGLCAFLPALGVVTVLLPETGLHGVGKAGRDQGVRL